jgi:spore maturation protein B
MASTGSIGGLVDTLSVWAIPVLLAAIPLYGLLRRLPVYETFVEGAEEGFRLAIMMIPYIVGILVALNIFEASGALDAVIHWLRGPLSALGVPPQVVPLMLVRPLSGGAALGITAGLLHRYGPDSLVGRISSTLQSSTDTTFYVLTLYFGSAGVRHTRYALSVALIGDAAGFIAAVAICRLLWG